MNALPSDTPPDAGASYMGVYGLRNPVVAWAVGRAADLLVQTPEALAAAGRKEPPPCPDKACHRPMRFRIERGMIGVWRCYNFDRHAEPTTVRPRAAYDSPDVDVIAAARAGKMLDYVYANPDGKGARWIVWER